MQVNAFYSTPSRYTDEKRKWKGSYEVRTDDIMPLADNAHDYWSGYFTSRPALTTQNSFKKCVHVRWASVKEVRTRPTPLLNTSFAPKFNFLQASRSIHK